ncbi:hypothetical protein E3E35_03910 [Thermococcus sp. GR7]|uniref:hypothetical protein n=1 Tax=unclassified Thermococcus TaxID=2627626 RepID=UPI001431EFD5|nr:MULTISPECIES: hypothetical protein [unclassified Thermococcus]NJE46575.1 hypothetical protein [Thermococcus sp. GR7]NJE79072.1 hypothetical protein [Thermococcus sp. GR4]NJF23594.1 hypothetical protein [Thermococcus sp. GR5]
MLKEIAELNSGVVLITGDGKRLAKIYLDVWSKRTKAILVEYLPFQVNGEVYIGSPYEGRDFDVYFIVNPLSRSKAEREKLHRWLEQNRDKLILLYETKYVKDSITRYRIREFIDYLIAYKRETVGFERVDVMRLENGRVVESKTYIRRS